MAEKLFLIDGHSMIYRAYYAPFRPLTSPGGEPTRATFVFTRQLLAFLRKHTPQYLAMAIDGPVSRLHRRALYPEYKITRKPMPSDLPPQVTRILEIVRTSGVPILQADAYEADDILATAVERFAGPDMDVVLISRDKDLDQLIGPHTVLFDPMKEETLDAAKLLAEKGYPPEKAVEVQSLSGDDTDNVPGIPGVGPKTAAKLIAQYGSAEAVLAHADELTPKLSESVKKNAANVALARTLVTLDRHVPIDLSPERIRFAGVRVEAVRPVFRELGFDKLVEDLEAAGGGAEPQAESGAGTKGNERSLEQSRTEEPTSGSASVSVRGLMGSPTTFKDFDYRCVDTPEALDQLVRDLQGVTKLAVDTETTSTHVMRTQLVGISLSRTAGRAWYLPVKGPLGATCLPLELLREKLSPFLGDAGIVKVGHNLKFDMIVLQNAGFQWAGRPLDTMVMAYVLDATRTSYRLDVLAAEFLNHRGTPITDLIGRGRNQITMDAVPIGQVTSYACEDADLSLRLSELLGAELKAEGLLELLEDLEMPLLSVLCRMERDGVLVDARRLQSLEGEFSRQADVVKDKIAAVCGANVNPDSPRQLAAVLFDTLKLPVLRKTSTGQPSTDESVLEQLAAQHELPALILEYRGVVKLISTYLVALRGQIHPRTGRVHTSFNQTGTETGRLSSSDPNLQNIPIRTEQGKRIRSAFIAAPGRRLLSADYSQVELRILAHLCQDPTLVKAFQDDQDIHRIVAAEVFGVPASDVTPEQRARAKTVNFGIIYGQTAFGLSRTLGIGRQEAGDFIASYHKRFPRIDEFLRQCVEQARKQGYVETILLRRRRITGIDSPNSSERAAAERLAINSVVQGSAADLIKRAMVRIAERIERERRPSRMLLQIHDELVFETPESAVEADSDMVRGEMEGAIELRVPVRVDIGAGANWMEAK